MVIRNGLFGLAALVVLASCAPVDVVLPGERLDIRAPFGQAENTENRSAPIHLARAVNHSSWPQRAGNASHNIGNAAFSTNPAALWTAPIGQGNDRRHRITAAPVAADARIFTLDSRALVSATSTAGATLWTRDLTPPSDNRDDASGGGLAVVGGTVFVTTGFGDLVALDATNGAVIWQQRLDAPATGAPTVKGGLVYVVTRDGRGWAIRADNGRVRWQLGGTPSLTGIVGGSGPAVGAGRVFFPFGSAQIVAAFPKGGLKIWSASVAGERLGRAYAQLSDVTGDPVVQGNRVYAGNPSGRTVALNATTGETVWTAREGATGPVVVAGGSVFLVSDRAQLVRLKSSNGRRIWASQLPDFQPARNPRRQRDVYAHFGPVLAGGSLWVASGDGQLRGFDPVNGNQVIAVPLPGGGASRPILVDGVMYVVSAAGQLMAFR